MIDINYIVEEYVYNSYDGEQGKFTDIHKAISRIAELNYMKSLDKNMKDNFYEIRVQYDFDKVEIRVAEVKEVSKVEGSEKLLKFRLDAGDGEDRQILSGIAKFYPDEQVLLGQKLQIVANLKPRKMMGLISQGMILSAEHNDKLTVLTVDNNVPNGSQIG